MHLEFIDNIDTINRSEWNTLIGTDNPFLRHEFLLALEECHCVGGTSGWIPHHLVAWQQDKLTGAIPLYIKYHSFGEFVFDWSWASAYEQAGLSYYPKLVAAVPFTPVTGKRILHSTLNNQSQVANHLITKILSYAKETGLSSFHCLFPDKAELDNWEKHGLMRRVGIQFHWKNHSYSDFNDFLSRLSAKKRKNIKRERRQVSDAGISFDILTGDEISDSTWQHFYYFYKKSYLMKGNQPSISLDCFRMLSETMPENTLLIMAKHNNNYVAGSFFMKNAASLYGRYWGCSESYHSLHFETCYYQAIEYCINNGLSLFEAGAQGEHKLSRGLLPSITYSSHWISNQAFRKPIQDFLDHESKGASHYTSILDSHSPYKTPETSPGTSS